ncbi:MAG: FMN-binding protein [Candidatus Hydrogenedentes bacterium]|nr:FMN-binding protein [Candidatus Hydrogenedentota bacterium]
MTASVQALTAEKPSSSLYIIGVLSIVSTICGIIIVFAYTSTALPIARNLAIITNEAVSQVVPGGQQNTIFAIQPGGEIKPVTGVGGSDPKLFAVYDGAGKLLGVAIEAAGSGYADLVSVMYAYSPERQAIIGFKLIDAKETPGLGDKIGTDPNFLANFNELEAKPANPGLAHPIQTVKHATKANPWEIDGISGATVSSNAVGRIINESAQKMVPLIERNLDQIRKGAS